MKLTIKRKTPRKTKTVSLTPSNSEKLEGWVKSTGLTASEILDQMIEQTTLDAGGDGVQGATEDLDPNSEAFNEFE